MSDLKIINNQGIYDISIAANGDLATDDSFDTALLMSLFVDRRADSSEVPVPELRRGWWGNLLNDIPDDENGSKLWLFDQARLTQNDVNKLDDEGNNAVQWLRDDNLVENIKTSINYDNNNGSATLTITYDIKNSATESRAYELWKNTGTNGTL